MADENEIKDIVDALVKVKVAIESLIPAPTDQNSNKEFEASQLALYDKAATYTKVIISLGYGGFFIAWSGTKQYLSPRALVASALCETFSLIIFISFEIWRTHVTNHLQIKFARAIHKPAADVSAAIETYKQEARRLEKSLFAAQPFIFWACAFTGLGGGVVLIYVFVAVLCRMWA